jgi:hypothetical protein
MKNVWGDGYDDDYYGSYYAPTYTPKSTGGWKSKYSGGGWSKSSWSNFSFCVDFDSDDVSNLLVKDPVSYITPTSKDIKKKVKARKQTSIDMIKELSRLCYFKMIDETDDYLADQYKNLSEEEFRDYASKKDLYDKVLDQYVPGFTPLEQAIAIYLKLKESPTGERSNDDDKEADTSKTFDFDRSLYSDPDIFSDTVKLSLCYFDNILVIDGIIYPGSAPDTPD